MYFNRASEEQRLPRGKATGLKRAREEEAYEEPTMSFEAYLTYDALPPAQKSRKVSVAQRSKRPYSSSSSAAVTPPEKRRRVALPVGPEILLPAIQPDVRPRPSHVDPSLSRQRHKVPAQEISCFIGKRVNKKTLVYSGSKKTAHPPRMMTPQHQPSLERCTPEELHRIQQKNQRFTKDLEELWMRHCRRHFKQETPREHESWRELYLRLQKEREERLKMLTSRISSSPANKHKGRQVIVADASPPPDVRLLQKQFGTANGSTAASFTAADPFKRKEAPRPRRPPYYC